MPPGSVIRAVDHPYRRNMLHILAREAMTYSQLFASMEPRGGGRGRFNYHLKVLREAALIVIQKDQYGLTPNGNAAVAFLEEVNKSQHDAAISSRRRKPLVVGLSLLFIGAAVISLLLTVLIPSPINSPSSVQNPGWSAPSLLVESTQGDVAIDLQGNGLRVWSEPGDEGNPPTVYGSRYASETGWSAPYLIFRGEAWGIRIARDSQGNAFVTWSTNSEGPVGLGLIATRYLSGVGWESPSVISKTGMAWPGPPVVALGPSGEAVALWLSCRDEIGRALVGCVVLSNRYTPETGWSEHTRISHDLEGFSRFTSQPRVGVDRWGNALAVWVGPLDEDSNGQVWANRFTPVSGWGTPVSISRSPGRNLPPDLSVGPEGEAVVVWYERDVENGGYMLHANRFTPAFGWSGPSLVSELGRPASWSRAGSRPAVHVGANGDALVVWDEEVLGRSPRQGVAIRAASFVSGVGWGQASLIDHVDSYSVPCRTSAGDGSGHSIVGWVEEGNSVTGDPPAAYASRYHPGVGWSARELVGRDPDADWMSCPVLRLDSSGNILALWTQRAAHPKEQSPSAREAIYVNRFVAPADGDRILEEIRDILPVVRVFSGLTVALVLVVGVLLVLHWRLRRRVIR